MQQTNVEIASEIIPLSLPQTTRREPVIWFQPGAYNVLNYAIDGCRVSLLPLIGAVAAHRSGPHGAINNVRSLDWVALYQPEDEQRFFTDFFPAIQAHLRDYSMFGFQRFPVPEQPHYASVRGILRPLAGKWNTAHSLVGRSVEELVEGKEPDYVFLQPCVGRDAFAVAPDYALLQHRGG